MLIIVRSLLTDRAIQSSAGGSFAGFTGWIMHGGGSIAAMFNSFATIDRPHLDAIVASLSGIFGLLCSIGGAIYVAIRIAEHLRDWKLKKPPAE